MRVGVAVYRDDPSSGGSLRVAQGLCAGLPQVGIDVVPIVAYGPCRSLGGASAPLLLRSRGPRDLPAWLRARGLIRERGIDLIHFVDVVGWLHFATLGIAPRVFHQHGRPIEVLGFVEVPRRQRLLTWLLSRTTDGYVAISAEARKDLIALGRQTSRWIWHVANSIDIDYWSQLPPREQVRSEFGLASDARVATMVCRLVKDRGCHEAIRLISTMPNHWHLLIAGDGPYGAELGRLAAAIGVAHRVHMTGLVDDPRRVLAAADAYLFLAKYDSFGMATAEAMMAGVPVFGLTGLGEYSSGPQPLISDETACVFSRSDSLDEASEADIERVREALLQVDSPVVSVRSLAARERVRSYYNQNAVGTHYLDIYTNIVAPKTPQ